MYDVDEREKSWKNGHEKGQGGVGVVVKTRKGIVFSV